MIELDRVSWDDGVREAERLLAKHPRSEKRLHQAMERWVRSVTVAQPRVLEFGVTIHQLALALLREAAWGGPVSYRETEPIWVGGVFTLPYLLGTGGTLTRFWSIPWPAGSGPDHP
jgi:hypothetical protein